MLKFIRPEFFDIFGVAVFGFITITSVWALKTGESFPRWVVAILLIIGVLGLLVDSVIVYRTYLRKKE